MSGKAVFGIDEIQSLLPHRPPFLFVDRVTRFTAGSMIVCERDIDAGEYYFRGHFPGTPIMPGVLVADALAQTSGLLWGFTKRARGGERGEAPEIFYLASANLKFVKAAFPGETLEMSAHADRSFGALFSYTVEAAVGRKVVAKGALTLAMMKGHL